MANVIGAGSSSGSANVGAAAGSVVAGGVSVGQANVSGVGGYLVEAAGTATGSASASAPGSIGHEGTGTAIGAATALGAGGIAQPPIGPVSIGFELNGVVYGMIASANYPGYDEPFAYRISTNSFLPVTGVSSVSLPITLASSGDWEPPAAEMIGANLVITHQGFRGIHGNFFGWFDLTNPNKPAWNAGNTTGSPLVAPPQYVAQFSNRFYFAVGNAIVITDPLTLNISNPDFVLLLGDSSPITCLAGMPLSTTSISIFQGVIAFKRNSVYQITGDPVTQDWAENEMSDKIGTVAARSVEQTPRGLMFRADDGIRNINFLGQVEQPDDDVALPFINALYPSRISAAYNANIYRVCVQDGNTIGAPFVEYWLDIKRGGWTGPHTFRQDIAIPYRNTFVVASNAYPTILFRSDVLRVGYNSFYEAGSKLNFLYRTSSMTDVNNFFANAALKSTLEIAFAADGGTYNIVGRDEQEDSLATASLTISNQAPIWGTNIWGDGSVWGYPVSKLRPTILPWTNPLVFNRLIEEISGPCSKNLKLGAFYTAYERLNYMLG